MVEDLSPSFENDETYKKFEKYYQEMKRSGLTKKQGFTADPLDTIGRKAYEDMRRGKKKSDWLIPRGHWF